MLQQIEHDGIGPMNVVDAQNHRAAMRTRLHDHRHCLVDGVACVDRVETIDGGWVAEQVREDIDETLGADRIDGWEHLLRALESGHARCLDSDAGIEVEVVAECAGDRPPHVGFAIGHARALQH